jgi:hypothetical protein
MRIEKQWDPCDCRAEREKKGHTVWNKRCVSAARKIARMFWYRMNNAKKWPP